MGGGTPEEIDANARAAAAEGFTAIKFDPLPGRLPGPDAGRAGARRRSTASPPPARRWGRGRGHHRRAAPQADPPAGRPPLRGPGPFRPLFIEDPVQIDSIQSQAEIARRITSAVANGERMHSIWEFRELLAYGGSQYVRPDVGLAGGLTHTKKIAALAESFHAAVVTHNFLGPVLTAASVHLDVSIPNFIVQEYSRVDEGALSARLPRHPAPQRGLPGGARAPGAGRDPGRGEAGDARAGRCSIPPASRCAPTAPSPTRSRPRPGPGAREMPAHPNRQRVEGST